MPHFAIFSKNSIRKIPLGILFLIATYYTSNFVLEISSFVSIGHVFRKALGPAIFFWGVFIVLYLKQKWDISLSFPLDRSAFSYKTLVLLLPLGFLFAILIVQFSFVGAVYVLIGFVCIIGLLLAVIFTLKYDDCRGPVILLIIYPFILFIQHYFRWKLSNDPYEIHSLNILMPHEIVWLLMFFAVIAHKFINKERFEILVIQKLFMLFGFFLLISAIFSPIPLTSLKYLYRDSFLPIVFLFIFIDRIRTTGDFKWLFRAVLFSGIVEVLIGIYFFWRVGGFHLQAKELFRSDLATTVTGYVYLVSILALILFPIVISGFVYEKSIPRKMLDVSFMIMCLGVIVLSKNRSVQLSFLITLPFMFLYTRAKLRYIFIPIVSIIVIVISLKVPYVLSMLTERYQKWFMGGSIVTNVLMSDSVSFDLWTSAIKIFLDHPFFGIGAGMWETVYPSYTSMPGIVVLLSGNKPHSLLLQYFAFAGLGAGLSYVFISLYTIIKCAKRSFYLKQKDLYLPILGLFWSIVILFLHETIRGYQIFNYFGYTVMAMCLFFGLDNLLNKTEKSYSTSMTT